jgi:hypothetical protein
VASETVGDDEHLVRPDPEHPFEVMAIALREDRGVQVLDEDEGHVRLDDRGGGVDQLTGPRRGTRLTGTPT